MDCGPTCLQMIAKYYGMQLSIENLRTKSGYNRDGVSLLGLSETAESLGFEAVGVKLTFDQLMNQVNLPCILHWSQYHFVVLTPNSGNSKIVIADPESGLIRITKKEFCDNWISIKDESGNGIGIALLLNPTQKFYQFKESKASEQSSWKLLYPYISKYRRYFIYVFLALFFGSLIQLILPFITQSIVDYGINPKDLNFVTVLLLAQLMLILTRTIVDFIRSRILLRVSTGVNISILSEFWKKLMKLPMSFFDTKMTGDIMQRIYDQNRIEQFLTQASLNTIFSIFSLVIFSIVLLIYNETIFLIYLAGGLSYFLWIQYFLKYRRRLDYKRFRASAKENGATMQLILGMQEIKLHNAEEQQQKEWQKIQVQLFKLSFESLKINQIQEAGAVFINEGKNLLITYMVAKLVIGGELTLGAMLAIQYMIGQLNAPVEQLIGFLQTAQDTKMSLERLNEIHQLKDEEAQFGTGPRVLPPHPDIKITHLSFSYPGVGNEPVLKDINVVIPYGKVTAIVGISGSGKTTLFKILLKFYEGYSGEIAVGDELGAEFNESTDFRLISPSFWRSQIGSVMQDGYIFNDTISRNIAVGDPEPDAEKLEHACRLANISEYINELPLGLNTKIGMEGNGLSQGQRQRLLIARAIYKDPKFIFLDEATNALDAKNEGIILENISTFVKGRTVLVIAHRLSTVKNADNILVFDKGAIIEAGTHEELVKKGGTYKTLVKNQLELGK